MKCENRDMKRDREPCPCCGHLTLRERGGFEICPVCFWEDDGQDDVDAHVDRGGPNRGTLWEARSNFLELGACEEVAKQHARRPTPDEPQTRHWALLDEVAVELIPATDVSPWNLLHDGTVVGLMRIGERVAMTVDIPYLRTRFDVPGVGFVLELLGGPEMEYAPYEGDAIASLDAIAEAEPDIVEAKEEDGRVVVWGSAGVLRLRYRDLALRFNDGAPLALAALDECARSYWDEWEKASKR
ncbi:MAG: hypothetical protein GY913_00735 [Proteobacteria bacterium]|nr:hypothetical protein [Pseudomonadota bacterium]